MIIGFVFLTLKCECQAADMFQVLFLWSTILFGPVCLCWRACVCVCVCVCVFIFLMHVCLLAMQTKTVLKQCIVI